MPKQAQTKNGKVDGPKNPRVKKQKTGAGKLGSTKNPISEFSIPTVMPFAKLFDCLLLSMLELGNNQWKNCYRKSPSWLGRKKLGPL